MRCRRNRPAPPAAACFYSRPRHAPRSTLFPYTTLFRSLGDLSRSDRDDAAAIALDGITDPGGEHKDRKSTRLNSSHSQISYAVFCLKKKKISNPNLGTKRATLEDRLQQACANAAGSILE